MFLKRKKQRQYIEGLAMLEDGLRVQLRQAEWRLGFKDLAEEDRIRCETLKKHCEYILEEIDNIWDGKLHY